MLPISGGFPLWNRGLPRIWNIWEGRNVVISSRMSVAVPKYLRTRGWPFSGIEICRGRIYSVLAWMLSWACVASRRIWRTKVGYNIVRVQTYSKKKRQHQPSRKLWARKKLFTRRSRCILRVSTSIGVSPGRGSSFLIPLFLYQFLRSSRRVSTE